MKKHKLGSLVLVGAGPGDPELITVKAVKALSRADVVLYDALIDKSLLDYVAGSCKIIFVGKRKNNHHYTQDRINQTIVAYALKGQNVVRLKGGDPFVFGRGVEEIEYASGFNIHCEVISGVSSAVAVPASIGISVTKRKIAESFWVVTATSTFGRLSDDIRLVAQSTATAIILMGISKIEEIVNIYQQYGRGGIGVAVIQNGTCFNEKFVTGRVDDIFEKVEKKNIRSPAIIVIGEVVNERYVSQHKTQIASYVI